jgi:hypothetical protein
VLAIGASVVLATTGQGSRWAGLAFLAVGIIAATSLKVAMEAGAQSAALSRQLTDQLRTAERRIDGIDQTVRESRETFSNIADRIGEIEASIVLSQRETSETSARVRALNERQNQDVVAQRLGDIRASLQRVARRAEILAADGRTPSAESIPDVAQRDRQHDGSPVRALVVNTIPKSGTYLVSALLTELGAVDSGLQSLISSGRQRPDRFSNDHVCRRSCWFETFGTVWSR